MPETATTETTDTAADTSTDTTAETTATTEPTDEELAALGDAGKKALDRMKAERDAAIAASKAASGDPKAAARIKAERDSIQALKNELLSMKAKAEGREAEYEAAQQAQKVKDEAMAAANQRILKAEVRVAAASKLADPADALLHLNLSDFEVGADGEVDSSQIAAAIDDLITKKPYLAAQGGKRFQGTADGGARNDATKPSQLTRDDLKRMSAEEIVKAEKEGRLDKIQGRM